VPLARLMYEAGVSHQQNSRSLALCYSDALVYNHKFQEASRVLAELDLQVQDDSQFSLGLWQRQVVVATALGAHEDARETARRLATALERDPEKLELCRQRFIQLGIPEAVAELTSPSPIVKTTAPKKKLKGTMRKNRTVPGSHQGPKSVRSSEGPALSPSRHMALTQIVFGRVTQSTIGCDVGLVVWGRSGGVFAYGGNHSAT